MTRAQTMRWSWRCDAMDDSRLDSARCDLHGHFESLDEGQGAQYVRRESRRAGDATRVRGHARAEQRLQAESEERSLYSIRETPYTVGVSRSGSRTVVRLYRTILNRISNRTDSIHPAKAHPRRGHTVHDSQSGRPSRDTCLSNLSFHLMPCRYCIRGIPDAVRSTYGTASAQYRMKFEIQITSDLQSNQV
jgi:hypothetical protein